MTETAGNARRGLAPGVRLRFDQARETWVLLAPGTHLRDRRTRAEILKRCDGAAHARRRSSTNSPATIRGRARRDRGGRARDARRTSRAKRVLSSTHDADRRRRSGMLAELTHRCPLALPLLLEPARARARARRARGRGLGARVRARPRRSACCRCISPAASRRRGATSWRSPRAAHDAGLYTNLITSGIGVTPARLAAAGATPASITCSSRSRTPSRQSADRIGGYKARMRASARSPARSSRPACR